MPKYRSGEVQMLGISHSGIRLIKRNRTKTSGDTLQVLESFLFDHIQQISPIRNGSTMDLRLTKKRITIHSHRVFIIKNRSNKYISKFQIQKIKQLIERFVKESRVHSRISKKRRDKYSPNLISNTSDLFKSSSQASFISCSQTFSELIPSTSFDVQTPKPTRNDLVYPAISALPSGHSMMEFALQNFKLPNRR
jgi:hypothetical protein